MVIFCPHCQKSLKLPEDYAGKTVRCPACQQAFVAPSPTGAEIQAAAPAPARPASAPKPAAEPAPRRRARDDDEEEFEDDREAERTERGERVARRAALVLTFAGTVTLVGRLFGLILPFVLGSTPPPNLRNVTAYNVGMGFGAVVCGLVTLILTVFVFLAARNLWTFGSRGMAMTGSILALVMGGLDLLTWIGCNAISLGLLRGQLTSNMTGVIYTQVLAGILSVLANLTAGIMGLLAVNNIDVSRAMQRPRRRSRRRRWEE